MELAKLRRDAVAIFHAGLKAVDPVVAVRRHLNYRDNSLEIKGQIYNLSDYENVYVIGMGKASASMAQAIEELFGERMKNGIINVKYGYSAPLKIIKVNEAGHPVPDDAGLRGTKEIISSDNPVRKPGCVISGGETTVTIHGKGLGGRNQEFSLAAAIDIDDMKNVVILSGGTDGTDGPTDAAGAKADSTTLQRARELKLKAQDYLRENDSHHFFQRLGDLLITGPTRTNVMDLRLILVS